MKGKTHCIVTIATLLSVSFQVCVALLRSMGFNSRLVFSLQPVTHKPNKVTKRCGALRWHHDWILQTR